MKYAHIETKTNKLLGWYDDEIHTTIPTPNIEVTDEVWQNALEITANAYEDGEFIVKDFRTDEEKSQQEIDTKVSEAKAYLSSTDWYYPRLTETGKAVPENVVVLRLAARDLINELEG